MTTLRTPSHLKPPQANPAFPEISLYQQGYQAVAGVDEVGRGCLAGPVFAAAVILPKQLIIPDVDDSKKLTPKKREALFPLITAQALAWSVAAVGAEEIDQINIHRASLKAMALAIAGLNAAPDFILVDGRFPIPVDLPQQPLIRGDSRSHVIGAASILAKVSRDRWMAEQATRYPGFFFERHKGYATSLHVKAIHQLGLTPLHRRTFSVPKNAS